MTQLLEKLEGMGRKGGLIALSVGLALLAVGTLALAGSWLYMAESGTWGVGGLRFGVALCYVFGTLYTLVGLRLLTQRQYPSAEEVFPPLSRHDFLLAVRRREPEGLCVCTRCRVTVPVTFSTGSCPVCSSSVDYYEVLSAEDAELVEAALV